MGCGGGGGPVGGKTKRVLFVYIIFFMIKCHSSPNYNSVVFTANMSPRAHARLASSVVEASDLV